MSPVEVVVARRADQPHTSMFARMLLRATVLRRGPTAAALLAMVAAAAVTTAMLNLYADMEAKLRHEFRSYGANIVVIAKEGASLSSDRLSKVDSILAGRGTAVPFAYVVATTRDGHPIVVAGTDFTRVRQLNRWWSVTAWPKSKSTGGEVPAQALVGKRAAAVVASNGQPFDLSFQGRTIRLTPAGTVTTGAAEDSRVFISKEALAEWAGVRPSTIEIGAAGSSPQVTAIMDRLTQALPEAKVRPVRQIMEAEERVLDKTRGTLFASALLIILTAALCLLATLLGWVLDRRRDFAIMRALGASAGLLNSFFAAEAVVLGVVGAGLGFVMGVVLAVWIGRLNFHAPVVPRFSVLPMVVGGGVVVALLSAVLPIAILRRIEPAMILRGE